MCDTFEYLPEINDSICLCENVFYLVILFQTETHHVDYMYPNTTSIVTKNAPFGTLDTPVQKGRIIGGKLVYGKEDGYYGT